MDPFSPTYNDRDGAHFLSGYQNVAVTWLNPPVMKQFWEKNAIVSLKTNGWNLKMQRESIDKLTINL